MLENTRKPSTNQIQNRTIRNTFFGKKGDFLWKDARQASRGCEVKGKILKAEKMEVTRYECLSSGRGNIIDFIV